jgi:hypothetical protein
MAKTTFFPIFLFIVLSFAPGIVSGQANDTRYFHEKLVVKALTDINAAQATYIAVFGNGNYGTNLDLREAGLIDEVLASGEKYGYYFLFTRIDRTDSTPTRFYVTATPRQYRKTGTRSFYINESGNLRGADKNGGLATINDPILDACKIIESSNEKCVIRDLRLLASAQITYQSTTGKGNFGTFEELYKAGLIPSSLATGFRHQYYFSYIITDQTSKTPASFKMFATPKNYGTDGIRSFYIDTTGILRGADRNGQQADENDPPIEKAFILLSDENYQLSIINFPLF